MVMLVASFFSCFQCVLSSSALAQVLYPWGHPSSFNQMPYGQGYVGTPGYIPATNYYRAPQITNYVTPTVPVTTYYAPQNYPLPQPSVVAAAYTGTVANYPPQTVLPANYATNYANVSAYPAWGNYATYRPITYYGANPYTNYYQPPVANYATPAFYRTNYARTPVTYYRPVQVMDPVSGGVNTVLQPAAGYEWQARRYQTYRLFPLFNRNQPTPYAGGCCGGAGCGSCGASNVNPYYVPNANTGVPYSQPVPYSNPSGIFPSGPATIAPPATYSPGTTSTIPNTSLPPASLAPSLNTPPSLPLAPTDLNSGPMRREYPPAIDSYPFRPNTSSYDIVPSTESTPALRSLPADSIPSLNGPANEATSSTSTESRRPQATIRRELNVTPVPDPEISGTTLKIQEPPPLLKAGDRTAKTESGSTKYQLMRYEQDTKPTTVAKPAIKTFGDDAWQPARK
jgi:hypothetical protein